MTAVAVGLIVCTVCELAKPAEAFYTVRGPRSVGDWPALFPDCCRARVRAVWRPGT
ncbi:MAG: hypothetical protein ACRD0K_16740 [Egibacteraceae bacterium]